MPIIRLELPFARQRIKYSLFTLLFLALPVSAATVDQLTRQGIQRADEGAAEQKRVETLADQTDAIVSEFKTVTKIVDGLKVYNGLLQRQIDNQQSEMVALQESMGNVALIERQIVPLMTRMIDSLEEFIRLDVPFLQDERTKRLNSLKAMMERSDVTAAEKFRRVIEAYQIENDYGRTIEAYRGSVDIDGNPQEVDFLRIGRISLMYQSIGAKHTAAWDQSARAFAPLSPKIYKQQVARGLKVARKEVAPDMLIVPVAAPLEVGQ